MRQRYIYDKDLEKLVPEEEYYRNHSPTPKGPAIISDEMGHRLQHPATGEFTSSKSEFRKMTKHSGCIEVGNETQTTVDKPLSRRERIESIRQAMNEVNNGRS